nr:hypothetical protein [Clostridium sp. D33t1_170424_F3]
MAHILTCAFTGHRPDRFPFQYDESHPDFIRLKKRMLSEIINIAYAGTTLFLSGMAQGGIPGARKSCWNCGKPILRFVLSAFYRARIRKNAGPTKPKNATFLFFAVQIA